MNEGSFHLIFFANTIEFEFWHMQ